MQKANRSGLRKKAAAIVALLAVCATAVGGTFAWQDYKQHKSNELGGSQIKYEARLVEDFEEVFDWKAGEDIKKEIRVANVGTAAAGYGDVYVRLQLKEFMQIGGMIFVETPERYMVAKGGQTYTTPSGKIYTFADGHYVIFDSEADAKSVFPNNNVKYLEDKVTGEKGWFIETKIGDLNGQYGKHVVIDYGFGDMVPVIPGSVFCPEDERNHHGYTDPATGKFITWSKECDYPIHYWDKADPTVREYIKEYIQWILGDDIIFLSDWDGTPVAAWIIDDTGAANNGLLGDGWAYWGQALQPGQATSNILEKVTLIKQPDGNFYYVIHVDMEALSIDEFIDPDGAGKDWATKPKDSYVNNRPTITWNGTAPASVQEGQTVNSPGVTVGPAGAAQGPLEWSSSNPALASVDPATGVVTGIKAGGPVTIIVKAPNGARGQYSLMVTPGTPVPTTVPATGVTINGGDRDMNIGQKETPAITKQPGNTTDTPVWSSSNPDVASVDPVTGEITAKAPGTAVITVTMQPSGQTDSITVTVNPNAPQNIPTISGEGPYQMQASETEADNYSIIADLNAFNFNVPFSWDQDGTIKLKDIIGTGFSGSYGGLSVSSPDPAVASKVSIGKDKDNDDAIVIKYYGTKAQWDPTLGSNPIAYPEVQVTLVLSHAGYADTTVKINLTFEGSMYG